MRDAKIIKAMDMAGSVPTALFVGPMKAGTSWIHEYLAWRGDVCLPKGVKETFFFDRYSGRGAEWYERRFCHCVLGVHQQKIEVAPSLFHCSNAPAHVRRVLGSVPIIFTLRDPIERSWSHYLHLRRKGYTNLQLREAVKKFPEIVAASQYEAQMARWRSALPESVTTVLHLEELKANPENYARRLCNALCLAPLSIPTELCVARNVGGVAPSFRFARLGRLVATSLRSAGFYGAVNFGKALGLKNVFFGGGTKGDSKLRLSPVDAEWLKERIASE